MKRAVLCVARPLSRGAPADIPLESRCTVAEGEPNNGWASVDCDQEQPGILQRAIDRATPGQTILVAGTCHENVTIPWQRPADARRRRQTVDGLTRQ